MFRRRPGLPAIVSIGVVEMLGSYSAVDVGVSVSVVVSDAVRGPSTVAALWRRGVFPCDLGVSSSRFSLPTIIQTDIYLMPTFRTTSKSLIF
jgi:hypothetical protein